MADTHVISALSKKRGELLGSIRHYKQLIKSLDTDLASIDATIRIFEPDFNFGSTKIVNKHKRNKYFETGEAKVMILDILRESEKPLKTDEISEIIANKKNLVFENQIDFKNLQKSVSTTLKNALDNKFVEKLGTDGITGIWKIKELN